MKKKTIALYVLVFALAIVVAWTIVEAQSKDPKPDPVAPAVSDKMHAKIRDVQLELSTLLNQQQQLAAQYQQLQSQIATDQGKLKELTDEALKEAHLNPEEWEVDTQKVAYRQKTKEPPQSATPPAKP